MLSSARRLRGTLVLALLCIHLAVLALQQLGLGPPWLAELTRFMPYYWLLLPCLLALALGMSRWLLAAGALNLLLLATFTMGLQWHWPLADEATGDTLRVLSYNVKALNARHMAGGFSGIDQEVRAHLPDIVALQDAQHLLPLDGDSRLTQAQPIFGLPYVFAIEQFVIASKYPVRSCSSGKLGPRTDPEPQLYLHCQLDVRGKRLDVVTIHFVSPRDALQALRQTPMQALPIWIDDLRERFAEAQLLLRATAHMPRPLLLMGDFNAPEGSPVVAELKRAGLRDSFAEAGQGYGYTYGHALDRKTDFLRIDHILVSPDIAVVRSAVGGTEASEHSPVVAEIKLP